MRKIKQFNTFLIKENLAETSVGSKASTLTGEVTLYRLTSHPVVDLSQPGEYYVCDKGDIDPNLLERKEGSELYLITVKCDSSNIDIDTSEREAVRLNHDSIVAVKDSALCKVLNVEPYGNNPTD